VWRSPNNNKNNWLSKYRHATALSSVDNRVGYPKFRDRQTDELESPERVKAIGEKRILGSASYLGLRKQNSVNYSIAKALESASASTTNAIKQKHLEIQQHKCRPRTADSRATSCANAAVSLR